MVIRSITPADQEQLGLLEEELHENEGKEHRATLEEALGSKEAISLLAEQVGDAVAYLLATEDQHVKGDLIVLRLAVRPAFQGQGYGSILIAALKDLAVQKEKKAIGIDCPEDLLSYFSQQGFRDEAESDRGVCMVWER
ncbi:GNAT family N-acetyltransferase [Streptococcus sp. 20925_1_77]|uniref:GNAT family N-acetyltransferase n=1 Tax=Streptococcus sp. 20925_1_77 TaxID=3003654 RepID=UPI00352EB0DB